MSQKSETKSQYSLSEASLLDNKSGLHDAVLLDPIDEESFVDNLRKRYKDDKIYVSSGHICYIFKCGLHFFAILSFFNVLCLHV